MIKSVKVVFANGIRRFEKVLSFEGTNEVAIAGFRFTVSHNFESGNTVLKVYNPNGLYKAFLIEFDGRENTERDFSLLLDELKLNGVEVAIDTIQLDSGKRWHWLDGWN